MKSMPSVDTTLGPVDTVDLGVTTMHEHVVVDGTFRGASAAGASATWSRPVTMEDLGLLRTNPSLQRDNLILAAAEMGSELALLRAAGTRTMLDVTAVGLRGDVSALSALAKESNVNIVASTGFYVEDSWPKAVRGWSEAEFRGFMDRELSEAVHGASFRAGHVKVAMTDFSDAQLAVLAAAGRVAAEHGVAVTVHPSFRDRRGPAHVIQLLEQAGLSPERVIIAHCDAFMVERDVRRLVLEPGSWGLRLDAVKAVLHTGATVSIDCFGHAWGYETSDRLIESDWQRLAGLVALINDGFASQLVVGCDIAMKMLTRRYGGHGYTRLNNWLFPWLDRLSVAKEHQHAIKTSNPARLLARVA